MSETTSRGLVLKLEIPGRQATHLEAVCAELEISKEEAVERALTAFLAEHAHRARRNAFGLWKGRAVKGVESQAKLRAGW
jgi:hypothetical protein